MKGWLKFFFLGFFSERIAKTAPRRGYGTMFLSIVVAIMFIALGYIGGLILPFGVLYRNSADFKSSAESVFCGGAVSLSVSGKRVAATYADASKLAFDTIANADTDGKYVTGGYAIIVDTRPADTFDDFTAYCVSESGDEIAYETYTELSDADKKNYAFRVRYSGRERVIDDAWVRKMEEYFLGRTGTDADAYGKLDKSSQKYGAELYKLYVKTYYPDLTEYESDGGAPRLRNYYYQNYKDRAKILFVFDDSLMGRFLSDNGVDTTFYGFYDKIADGKIGATPDGIRGFLTDAFFASSQLVIYVNTAGIIMIVPYVIFMFVLLAMILYCARKLLKSDEVTFGGAAKTVGAYSIVCGLLAGVATLLLGMAVSVRYFTMVSCVAFFAFVSIRIAASAIADAVKLSKTAKTEKNVASCEKSVRADAQGEVQ